MLRYNRIREQEALTEAMVDEGRHSDRPLSPSPAIIEFRMSRLSEDPITPRGMPGEEHADSTGSDNAEREEWRERGERIWRRVHRAIYDAVHTILGSPPADVADKINDVLDQAKRDWREEQKRKHRGHDAPAPQPDDKTND